VARTALLGDVGPSAARRRLVRPRGLTPVAACADLGTAIH
jgi:hypothetical protein